MAAFLFEGAYYRYIGLLEDGVFTSLDVMPLMAEALAGEIYIGRIVQAIPNQETYFVDIGQQKLAYLQGKDIVSPKSDLGPGAWLMVQIKQAAHGTKGPKVTEKLAIQGRWTVVLTDENQIMASHKIHDEDWRTKTLSQIQSEGWLSQCLQERYKGREDLHCGLILRTEAQGTDLSKIYQEVSDNINLLSDMGWQRLQSKVGLRPKRCYRPESVWEIQVKQWVASGQRLYTNHPDFKAVSENEAGLSDFLTQFYTALTALLRRRHTLKNGCTLVIDELEALTAIDVNSAAFVGQQAELHKNQYALNQGVIGELCDYIKLRKLSGMLLVDFVNMSDQFHKPLIKDFKASLKIKDIQDIEIKGFTRLGMLEMARRRTTESLLARLCSEDVLRGERRFSEPFQWDFALLEMQASRWRAGAFCLYLTEESMVNLPDIKHYLKRFTQGEGQYLPPVYYQKQVWRPRSVLVEAIQNDLGDKDFGGKFKRLI